MSDFFRQFFPARRRLAQGTLAFAGTIFVVGCGSSYRPVTTPITPTGPASQPGSFAFVISTPSPTSTGIGTVVDYSGDTIMASAPIGPAPMTFALNAGGSEAWSLNSDGTISNIPVSTNLQAKQIQYSTLNSNPLSALFSGSVGLFALDVQLNQVDVLTGSPDAFKLVIPVDPSPVTMVGVGVSQRYYAIAQNIPYLTKVMLNGQSVDGGVACNINPRAVGINGIADGIEATTNTVSSHITVGVCPVYAVGSADGRRIFVLNRGSDTVSVIDSQINTIDSCVPFKNQNGQLVTCHPSLPLSTSAGLAQNGSKSVPSVAGPVYAEFNQTTSQLIVANYDGGTINVIDVSLDQYGNDSPTFGTTYTIPVGKNPASVTVLADATRAYVANQSDGTVSVVNLSSHTLDKTLPVYGHPRTVVSTVNSLYGKVYVASPDSPYITIVRTDQDIVDTTVLVQGNAIDVRSTSPDATSQNVNTVSRLPGAGQPCFLPASAFTAVSAPVTLANCRVQDPTLLTTVP